MVSSRRWVDVCQLAARQKCSISVYQLSAPGAGGSGSAEPEGVERERGTGALREWNGRQRNGIDSGSTPDRFIDR